MTQWAFDALPSLFKEVPNCVLWHYEERDGKRTKVPYQPLLPTKRAKAARPGTWGSFRLARRHIKDSSVWGIGFNPYPFTTMIQEDRWQQLADGTWKNNTFLRDLTDEEIKRYQCHVTDRADLQLVGIDIDHCIDEYGQLTNEAEDIVQTIRSYTEVSPSGTGLRIFAYGTLPPYGRRHGAIEMYTEGRFLTLTGHRIEDMPNEIAINPDGVLAVHAKYIAKQAQEKPPMDRQLGFVPTDDHHLINRIGAAKNGRKFDALWCGDISGYPESVTDPGHSSEADLAFCSIVAFWAHDAQQIDRLFRQSGLMRKKWDEQRGAYTYGEKTIQLALSGVCA